MTDSPQSLQARRSWVTTYYQTRDAGLTCRRCGISRPTLRKWLRRFEAEGKQGLRSRSRRPHRLAPSKLMPALTETIHRMLADLHITHALGTHRRTG